MVMSYFQRIGPECENESFFTTGGRKKTDCFSVVGFWSLWNIVFEAMGCFYHFCPCQELRPSLTEGLIQRVSKKRELDALRQRFIQQKGFKVIEMWECEWWRLYETTLTVKKNIRKHFPHGSWATFRKDKGRKVTWLRAVRHWSTWKLEIKIC